MDLFKKMSELVRNADGKHWERGYRTLADSVKGNTVDSPYNYETKRNYTSLNVMTLSMSEVMNGYDSNQWLTFNQITKLGGKFVKDAKGKGEPVIFCQPRIYQIKDESGEPVEDEDGNPISRKGYLYRVYTVFNVSLTDLPYEKRGEETVPKDDPVRIGDISMCNSDLLAKLDVYKSNGLPPINWNFGGRSPSYSPALDVFNMPDFRCFRDESAFWHTFYHEIGHSTGSSNRLNRAGIVNFDRFGSDRYAKEELVAEMCANLCMTDAPFTDTWLENSAEYLRNWLDATKDKKRRDEILYGAFSGACKAYAFINNGYKAVA